MNATVLRDLCRDCAAQVYGNRPPTPAYAEADALARLQERRK